MNGNSFSILEVREGDYELSATIEGNGQPPGPSYYIADIRSGGISVFGDVFHVGVDPQALEVIVATEGASLQGKLLGSTSPLPAAVILVPDFPRRGNASLYRVVYVPRNGEFKMNGVAPGTYKIFAVPYLNETVPYRSAEFIARHESRAVSVVVRKDTNLQGMTVPYLALGR
jgi:hypothetical protein